MNDIAPEASIEILQGSARDLDRVIEVMSAAFDRRYGEAWTRSQCAGILPMPGVRLTLAKLSDGAIAGFSLLRTVADDAELLLIAVDPPFRRKGIGRMLLGHFLDHAAKAKARRAHLEVRAGNPAVAMYRSNGFEPVGRRRKYYIGTDGSQFDAITLSKSI